jgi:hypothetical protein
MGAPRTATFILDFMMTNADRLWTLEQLEKELAGKLNRKQISNALTNLRRSEKYPNLESTQSGVWRWNSTPTTHETVTEVGDDIIVTIVLKEDSGRMLVKDDTTGDLFLMSKFRLPE